MDEYDEREAIVQELPRRLAKKLCKQREHIRRVMEEDSSATWQGVALSELEHNRRLVSGPDFGGEGKARYLPAVERYGGRLYLGLGPDRADVLRPSRHHLLLLSGLYGVVRAFEPLQLYSCPLVSRVAQLWRDAHLLTEVLSDYVVEHSIERIIDLTAVDAYRRLVDWQEVSGYGPQVLHAFYAMGAGDDALIPFGRVLRTRLLEMPERELLALAPEASMDGVVFRAQPAPASAFPDEASAIVASRAEEDIVQVHAVESASEVIAGGNPVPPVEGQTRWKFAALSGFQKEVWRQRRLFDRIANAIVEVCADPLTPRGNTIKPLTGTWHGYWRYRLGDFRLVYRPDTARQTVYCHRLAPRGGVYD